MPNEPIYWIPEKTNDSKVWLNNMSLCGIGISSSFLGPFSIDNHPDFDLSLL